MVVLDSLNPERITLGAGCVGCASLAVSRVLGREVFDRPIGKNQGIYTLGLDSVNDFLSA